MTARDVTRVGQQTTRLAVDQGDEQSNHHDEQHCDAAQLALICVWIARDAIKHVSKENGRTIRG